MDTFDSSFLMPTGAEKAAVMITKSSGITETERMLAEFCERSFLKLWSYPNPYKDDGHELCDLLAVFGDYVFIFFDRENQLAEVPDKAPQVLWDRWKRSVIDRQVKTAHGAERYIRSGRPIFLDGKKAAPFPLPINGDTAIIHKIIVAHGAKEACERDSDQNIYGSLAIIYCEPGGGLNQPFHIEIEKNNPVHIFDSHNLPIVLEELNTVTDLSTYLDEKLRAVAKFDSLLYCGEEDLLAHYLLNYDKKTKKHIIGTTKNGVKSIFIGEGEWRDFINSETYKNTKKEDKISYFWDELIQRTCKNVIDGTVGGNSDIFRGQSAIFEMVKEPRFVRRALADKMRQTVMTFPDHPGQFTRQVTFLPSYLPNVGYVFFQLRTPENFRAQSDYREKRRTLLEIACGAARNKFPHLTKVIGIGMDAPKFAGDTNSEDFILLPCEAWTDEMRDYYEEQNQEWRFFGTPQLKKYNQHVTQFVPPKRRPARKSSKDQKVGRNEPCPCGSGDKYKRCHGA
ncbi:MAG TPA: SEC-C metal-binding domain-containing protein [Candidatus Binatia bacterium]|nr:SEC-C metal-binding domain-containing protein [Candidatus Binatia bacterium]